MRKYDWISSWTWFAYVSLGRLCIMRCILLFSSTFRPSSICEEPAEHLSTGFVLSVWYIRSYVNAHACTSTYTYTPQDIGVYAGVQSDARAREQFCSTLVSQPAETLLTTTTTCTSASPSCFLLASAAATAPNAVAAYTARAADRKEMPFLTSPGGLGDKFGALRSVEPWLSPWTCSEAFSAFLLCSFSFSSI